MKKSGPKTKFRLDYLKLESSNSSDFRQSFSHHRKIKTTLYELKSHSDVVSTTDGKIKKKAKILSLRFLKKNNCSDYNRFMNNLSVEYQTQMRTFFFLCFRFKF